MKSVLEKVWPRLVIVVLMVSVLVIGMTTRCYNTRDTLPEGACYVIRVEKTDSKVKKPVVLTLVYDSKGNLLRHREGNEQTDYTYDDQGRLLSSHGHELALDLPLQMIDYTYDEMGKLIKEEGYYMQQDRDAYYCTYDYDAQGNMTVCKRYQKDALVKEWRYSSNGALVEQIHHKYNRSYQYTYTYDGKLLSESYTYDDGNGVRTEKTEYTYSMGKLKKKSCLPWRETVYTYGDGGRLVQKVHTDKWQDKVESHDYAYDLSGRLISYVAVTESRYMPNATVYRYEWAYDDLGQVTQLRRGDRDGNYYATYTWDYDAAGNVTKFVYHSKNPWVCEFVYTWPEGELPQAVKESAAAYIAEFTMLLNGYMPAYYLQD